MRVTPTHVQATEAVLRGALEPLATLDEGAKSALALEASPRKQACSMCSDHGAEAVRASTSCVTYLRCRRTSHSGMPCPLGPCPPDFPGAGVWP